MIWRLVRALVVLGGTNLLAISLISEGRVWSGLAVLAWVGAAIVWAYDEGKRSMGWGKKSSEVTHVVSGGQPDPPVNARAVMPNGTEIPLELVYVGVDARNCHLWENVNALPAWPTHTSIDVLPAHTAISIRVQE